MPELPEVETTRRGLTPFVVGRAVSRVIVRERRLRWPVPRTLAQSMAQTTVKSLTRRGKYLLWECVGASPGRTGFLLSHLGMSGTLQTVSARTPLLKHDHLDIVFSDANIIRFNDPRRFGAMLWINGTETKHPLLDALGPEPLTDAFDGKHLYSASRGRTVSVKEFIMNGHIVVGVGNIYASEALFRAGINPQTAAGRISHLRYQRLADAIKATLAAAIDAGGSSLKDYFRADGTSGYFQNETRVYDREGQACVVCGSSIKSLRQGQRSTFFCPRCQH